MCYAAQESVLYVFGKRNVYMEPAPVLSPVGAASQAGKEADESRRDCVVAANRCGLLFFGVCCLPEYVLGVLCGILAADPVGPLSICPEPVPYSGVSIIKDIHIIGTCNEFTSVVCQS